MTQSQLSELSDEALLGLKDSINQQIQHRADVIETTKQIQIDAIKTKVIDAITELKELGVQHITINKNTISIK